MTPERWEKIKNLLATALDLPADKRAVYLDNSCEKDDALRREVELLLQREPHVSSGFLDQAVLAKAVASVLPEKENPWIGRRVGVYQVVEQIGTGGMGEVYRAFRADEQYRKEVALKLIRAGQDSGAVIARFRNERQILATLEHPNIARLLDGGETEAGTPYLVMELIDGQPLGEYCDAKKLSISHRLALFIQVCSAVQYAHQRLIIHRDIKPSNILVTAEGVPKLLDFGIARVFESDPLSGGSETLTLFRPLTPEFASPEQINGELVTTASDIYSLGVVLYYLLAGRSPYPLFARTAQELTTAICTRDPERPSVLVSRSLKKDDPVTANTEEVATARGTSASRLQKQLRGDLDNIVLMALRKDPARRYASAEQFAADIQRHVESIPVVARKDTATYRTSRFIRRHKVGAFASLAVVLAVLGGLVVSSYEAHVARRQAEIAREQRLRAEHRFNDVRKLANSLMFEIHDSIKDLPGATPTRRLLVNRALEYLDSLSQEASGDATLQRELAAAYDRVGDVLGYDGAANLGDFNGAIDSYKKALAIRETAAAASPNDLQSQADLFSNYFRLSFALDSVGDGPGALADLEKAVPVAQKLAATSDDGRFQDWLAGTHWQTGNILRRSNEPDKALQEYRISISIREPLAHKAGASALVRTHLAADYSGLSRALGMTGDTADAVQASGKALRILEDLSAGNPNDATVREYLGEAYSVRQSLLQRHGDLNASIECGRKALQIFKQLASQDPTNALAVANAAFSQVAIGEELALEGNTRQGTVYIRQAMNVFEDRSGKTYDLAGQAESYSALATVQEALADRETTVPGKAAHLRKAESWLQKSLRVWHQEGNHGTADPLDGRDIEHVKSELAKCESALAKL